MPKGGPSREAEAHWTRDDREACVKTDEYCREWQGYLDKHSDEDQDVVFQRWIDQEGRRAVRQKVE